MQPRTRLRQGFGVTSYAVSPIGSWLASDAAGRLSRQSKQNSVLPQPSFPSVKKKIVSTSRRNQHASRVYSLDIRVIRVICGRLFFPETDVH